MKRTVRKPYLENMSAREADILSRFREARKWHYTSAKKAAAAMAGTPMQRAEDTIAKHERGENKFTIDELMEYADFYRANPIWIITGGGPKRAHEALSPDDDQSIASRVPWKDLIKMPKTAISEVVAAEAGEPPPKALLIETVLPDSSMNHVVPSGYTITIDCRDRMAVHGQIYLFHVDGEVLLRRYHKDGQSSALLSDSTESYPFMMVGKKELGVIGRMVSAKKIF